MSYLAHVVAIKNIKPHSNADRLQLWECFDSQVIIDLSVKEWDIGLYFPVDGCLSKEFAQKNDLIRRKNKDWTTAWWMFDENCRVRAQSFRKERSEWFWIPIKSIDYITHSAQEWDAFDAFEWHEICHKYINPNTLNAQKTQERKVKRGEALCFHKHVDTENIKYNWDELNQGDLITITSKLHGTSQRSGWCYESPERSWIDKLFWRNKPWFQFLIGSRNVIISDDKPDGFYSTDFRFKAAEPFKAWRKWEVFYYEIVWYEPTGTPIMWTVTVKWLDKDTQKVVKEAGMSEEMTYHYSCNQWEFATYVYRIVQYTDEWEEIELSWNQIKKRCREIGVNHVPETIATHVFQEADGKEYIKHIIQCHGDWPCKIGKTHWSEWLVIRVDSRTGKTYYYKAKNFIFLCLEWVIKDSWVVDAEESA